MPLGVITVDYGKHESIFEKLNPFVDKLVTAYKQKQLNEWDNEWMTMAIKDIENASDPDTINALMEKQNPPEGYIDIEGATSFATDAVGMLRRKEISQNTPQNGASMQNGDIFPDKMEFNELFAYVQSLPSGQVDWSNTLGLFKERLESKRKMGDAAQQFLNQILGQGIPDQRAKFEDDFNLAKDIRDTLYPETEQQEETFDPEAFLQANPDMEITGYNSNTRGYTFRRKEQVEEKPQIDVNKLVTTLEENGMKLSSANFNPTTGNLSYSFTAEKPDTGTTKASWEQNLAKAQQFVKNNPDYEITGTNPDSGSVTISKMKPQGEEGTTGKPPAYGTAQNIKEDLIANVETKEDYNNEINRLKALNIDTSSFSYKDIVKEKYNQAMQWVKYSFDMIGAGIEQDENYNYKQLYKDSWESAKKYDKEYQKETGKKLLSAPGEETPINSNTTNAFIHDAQASGYTLADYDIEELKKAGVDIEKARQALGN